MPPNSTATGDLILVVDDDVDIATFVRINLEQQGYQVVTAHNGIEALSLIEERKPALAIIDWMMPGLDGLQVTRRVRSNPLTAPIPIILLTARGQAAHKVMGLDVGADDYVVKPFDTLELVARVRSTLRRNQDYRDVSPLTGLPGNNRILREITERMRSGSDYAVCHIDIDRFKSVNDAYDIARGDLFIISLSKSLHRAVTQVGPPPAFFGHVGGDDFVVVSNPDQVRLITELTVLDFQDASDALYDEQDRIRGYVEVTMRNGTVQQANLVTLSIGVALSTVRHYRDAHDAIAVASEMKSVAKKHPGSYVALDRRSRT